MQLFSEHFFLQAIVPKKGQTKAPRLRAMDRNYHLECFKWVDGDGDGEEDGPLMWGLIVCRTVIPTSKKLHKSVVTQGEYVLVSFLT